MKLSLGLGPRVASSAVCWGGQWIQPWVQQAALLGCTYASPGPSIPGEGCRAHFTEGLYWPWAPSCHLLRLWPPRPSLPSPAWPLIRGHLSAFKQCLGKHSRPRTGLLGPLPASLPCSACEPTGSCGERERRVGSGQDCLHTVAIQLEKPAILAWPPMQAGPWVRGPWVPKSTGPAQQ